MNFELRRQRRLAMQGTPERVGLSFAGGGIEMRAKPSGHGTTSFEWNGYATVYRPAEFPMWDPYGEPYTEDVDQGACRRSLANPGLDVPFLVGHNDAGIPFARTKSGTMSLAEDTTGLHVHVPSMDGRREEVRALASAVERGDMDEMSLAFVCRRQQWDEAFERRTILEMDLHRGDVCAVVHGANPATAGASMFPVEQLSFRRPVAIGAPRLLRASVMHGDHLRVDPDGDGDCDACPEGDTDHDYWTADGQQIMPLPVAEGYAAAGYPFELLAVSHADRDQAKAAGNSLPDGSYPINNVHQLHAAAVLAASHHGDWQAAQALIRRRAKELGVDVTTLPGFGDGQHAASRPVELRASAADDFNLSMASDYNPGDAPHDDYTGTHAHPHQDGNGGTHDHPHTHDGDAAHGHDHSSASNALMTVDDSTGIPSEETQMAAKLQLERMAAELELEVLARR